MKAVVISVGEELVSGACVDTNTAWLSLALAAHGVVTIRHVTVGDDVTDIATAFRQAMSDADLVVSTGGLGPTPDDLTRQGLADALRQPLEHSTEAEQQIRALFERWQRTLHESNLVQALIPHGCAVLENPRGTAPGIAHDTARCRVFVLPGVPIEMKTMYEQHIVPRLSGGGAVTLRAELRCYGMSEAELGERLADMMARNRNPLVGTTASGAVLTVRITARSCSESEALRLLDAEQAEVRRRIGQGVFGVGEEELEDALAKLLTAQGRTVATAESCTGGLLAQRLTNVPGSSAYFFGGMICYADQAKTDLLGVSVELIEVHGAVSEPVAVAMAQGCRARAGSDFAISTTGIAGPSGGRPEKPVGLVFIALASPTACEARRFLFGEHLTRCEIRDRAAKTAMNMLRLHLLRREPTGQT